MASRMSGERFLVVTPIAFTTSGRVGAAIAPSRMITMEITQARTGRSMKKRASMKLLLQCITERTRWSGLGGELDEPCGRERIASFGSWHIAEFWLNDEAGAHLLNSSD